MKWVKRAAGVIAGIFIFCMIVNGLNYMYVSVDNDVWRHRILWNSFYEDKGKIDNLYLGPSHVYHDIDPFLLDKLNGQYNFNLSSSAQLMNGTYYLLREADKYNDLSHVYVELYYLYNTKNNFTGTSPIEEEIYRNWINTDYMEMSLNKLEYMFDISDSEKYPDIFFAFSRYRANLGNWDIIRANLEEKRKEDYINYKHDEYKPRGSVYSPSVYSGHDRITAKSLVLGENPMAEASEEYLRKVIIYCRKRNIPVTLFVAPVYELGLLSVENYDNYLNQVKNIATEYGIDIYDFNLAKEEYFPVQDTKYFRDIGHLSTAGTDMFTRFFHKVVTEGREKNKKYFYDSYAQKLESTEPGVYGIYYHDNEPAEDGTVFRNMFVASNRKTGMEYRIIMTPDSGKEQYVVQDFNENRAFVADVNEHGVCTIVYRMKDTPDKVQTVEINY